MGILFIESHKFTEQVARLNAQEAVWELENELLQNPDKGDLIVAAVQNTVKLYREGHLGELRTRERKPLKPLKPAQIRAIRRKWGASQAIFADILNVPKKTYISWESGYKHPSGAALKLLMIAKEKPEALLVA